MANVFYLAGFIEAWGRGYEKIREAFETEKLEIPVFEEVRGGMMATIKREKFMAIQAKGGVVETASSIARKIKLSPRTIGRKNGLHLVTPIFLNPPNCLYIKKDSNFFQSYEKSNNTKILCVFLKRIWKKFM